MEEPVEQTSDKKRVAIACQGGGSHAAFTAGVLKGLLRSEQLEEYEVVALSGTSGGAVCAARVAQPAGGRRGGGDGGSRRLLARQLGQHAVRTGRQRLGHLGE